jgi:hypothetical protein
MTKTLTLNKKVSLKIKPGKEITWLEKEIRL